MGRLDTEEFVRRSRIKHGTYYDYSLSIYTCSKDKVRIICPTHGVFEQVPHSHMGGKGCASCKIDKLASINRYSKSDFVNKSKLVHGDKYDYSPTVYSKSTEKVKIVCPNHGEFEQTALSHMNGKGCNKCYINRVTTDTYVDNVKSVHGDKYDYSLVNYTCSKDKVKIICPTHGVFEQVAGEHVRGHGCSQCAHYGFDKDNDAQLYFLISEDGEHIKIGVTSNIERRVNELRLATPFPFSLVEKIQMKGSDAVVSEKFIHSTMRSSEMRGFDGATEWFRMGRVKRWVK